MRVLIPARYFNATVIFWTLSQFVVITQEVLPQIMSPKDADGIANFEDPVPGLHLFPRTVCPKTSRIFMEKMVFEIPPTAKVSW